MELEDEEFGFELVTPLKLMEHIESGCQVVDSIDVKDLITQRDTPLDLDRERNLKTTFKNILKILKKLRKNKVEKSESEMMVNLLLQLEEEEDFDDNVVDWKSKTKNGKTLINFQTFFVKAYCVHRAKNKLRKKTSKSASFNSAHATVTDEVQANHNLINKNFSQLAKATKATIEEKINAAIEKWQPVTGKPKATATTTPKEAVNLDVAMLRFLEDLSKRLTFM